jgi:ATP sulfurylase
MAIALLESCPQCLKNAQEVLEVLSETSLEDGKPLPKPITFGQSSQLASTLIQNPDTIAVIQQK